MEAGVEGGAAGPAPAGEQDEPAAAPAPDPHAGLAPLLEATALCRARVAVVRVPMHWDPARPSRARWLEQLTKLLVFLPPHLRLVADLWRRRDHDLVLVREFLTQVLGLVWPLIWPLRRRVRFLVNHNLQEAHERPVERAILRALHRTGCRFACLESAEGFAAVGVAPEGVLVLPHPVGPLAPPRRPRAGPPAVGVVGSLRDEKGSAEILESLVRLRDQGRLAARLVLGCPESDARAVWAARGYEVLDTSARHDYLAAFDAADVIVLNYQRHRYYYRPSGVAADALARRAAVVAPDFPLMRRQLSVPAPVGATFADPAGLAAALERALALRPGLDDGLAQHAAARSPAALAALLERCVAVRGR